MMKYNPEKHNRRSIRLKEYDYSQAGAYFVTICSWNRKCLFGEIIHGEVVLNEYGHVAMGEWIKTSTLRPNIELDTYVVMPNHFHGILMINDCAGTIQRRGVLRYAPTERVTEGDGFGKTYQIYGKDLWSIMDELNEVLAE
ncbi:MAG: hypothetical protein MRK02_00845 [Candidatus Scalindua sp.]|nr:hypothetical protein [Candidatus Scalindua sp.]